MSAVIRAQTTKKRKRSDAQSFISPQNEIVKIGSAKQFAELTGCGASMSQKMMSGIRSRYKGWCSTHKRAKRHLARFTTVLVNTQNGDRKRLGMSVKAFARDHGLCFNELSKLVNERKAIYRHWILEKTLQNLDRNLADEHF